jgi:hypothetical protein
MWSIPKQLLGKVSNVLASDKDLYCKSCDAITEHLSISWSDFMSCQSGNLLETLAAKAQDIQPSLLLGNPYACKQCKQLRSDGGILSGRANENLLGKKLQK